jgi:hypothetical protein
MTKEEQEEEQFLYEQYLIESEMSPYEIEKCGVSEYKVAKNRNVSITEQPKKVIEQ